MSGDFEDCASDGDLALSLSCHWPSRRRCGRSRPGRHAWSLRGQKCHANADRWVMAHPSWRVVRGWVLLCNEPFRGAHYAAHSVVEDPAGVLWDVTLADGIGRSFLAHLGDLVVFMQRITEGRWTIVREPLALDADWRPQLE